MNSKDCEKPIQDEVLNSATTASGRGRIPKKMHAMVILLSHEKPRQPERHPQETADHYCEMSHPTKANLDIKKFPNYFGSQ